MLKKSFLECIRSSVKCTILILIFSITFTALSLAVNYYNYVQTNISEIEISFTTIAVPDTIAINSFLPSPYMEQNGQKKVDYTPQADFYLSLRNFAKNSQYGKLDNSELLRGVCKNATPILSGAFDPLEYNMDVDTPRNSAAFIVTAMNVEYIPQISLDTGLLNSGGGTNDSAHYIVKFRIDETIILNQCYHTPEYIYVSAGAFTSGLQCPYVIGKQYFISGIYHDVSVIQKELDNGTPFPDTYLDFDDNSVPSIYLDGSNFNLTNIINNREAPVIKDFEINGEITTAYTYSNKELAQMCIAYNGDLNSLLANRTDIAERLDNANINSNSIEIHTTGNLNSILFFNQGKAFLVAGRNFTETENSSGKPVCIINERFATYNKLKVGDSIKVDLYNPIMRRMNGDSWVMTTYNDPLNPMLHEREVSRGSLELKVVGIYSTQQWEYSAYSINYNTVFIPSNSVPVKFDITLPNKTENLEGKEGFFFAMYSQHMIPSLFTVIIPNNKIDDFKSEANAAGVGDYFLYNDQGYIQVKESLPVILGSTRVFIITALVGFLAVFIFYLVLLLRKRQSIGMLISLGAKRHKAAMSEVFGCMLIIVPSLMLCFNVVMLTGVSLIKIALNSTIEQLQFNNTFSVGTQVNTVDLINKFGKWTNGHMTTILLLLSIFVLYFVTAMVVHLCQSRHSVLKLLRRYE